MQKNAFHEIWTWISRKVLGGIRVGGCNRVLKIPFDSCIQGITQGNRRKEDVFEFNKDAVASIEVSTNGELLLLSFLPLVTTL